MNVHTESENEVMQGCIPLFINGRGDFPKEIFNKLEKIVAAINIAFELDAGIFEYLPGELIGILAEEANGQLVFTSHNLRIMDKLGKKNIVCSTINPDNRYISLKGIEKTHNRRDFYIRTIVSGGQKEKLYDDTDLQDMGYAFRKAGNTEETNVQIPFSAEFMELLKNS